MKSKKLKVVYPEVTYMPFYANPLAIAGICNNFNQWLNSNYINTRIDSYNWSGIVEHKEAYFIEEPPFIQIVKKDKFHINRQY